VLAVSSAATSAVHTASLNDTQTSRSKVLFKENAFIHKLEADMNSIPEFLYSPSHPERLWGPRSLLSNV